MTNRQSVAETTGDHRGSTARKALPLRPILYHVSTVSMYPIVTVDTSSNPSLVTTHRQDRIGR
ncbi:hypothetical protein [uncultured Bifidobacterium sp.]|uniref:hypothetical protein n=1 Tax=uncultured Bifidobacterium sp. TaxID=165187 RepID=UPI0028DC4757|nr:hypothetical protein [uncultured Bifidobacterium sp.]